MDDTSFLNRGYMAGDEIQEQRLHLQDCLISYLNQSSKMMNLTMAMKEASIMLQKSARLELHNNTSYYVVPNWVLIFRRVFNWRLNVLASRSCSKAYIREKHDPPLEKREESGLVGDIGYPSLDEMMDVSLMSPAPLRHVPVAGTGVHGNLNETTEASSLGLVREPTSQVHSVQDYVVPLGLGSSVMDSENHS